MNEVTQVLDALARGDACAADRLLPLVYDELRRLAGQKMAGEKAGQTLQATALVHEAYLRLLGDGQPQPWNGRGHLFAAAAEAMRRILVDRARRKRRPKHGGDRSRQDLDGEIHAAPKVRENLLALDEALRKWAARIGRRPTSYNPLFRWRYASRSRAVAQHFSANGRPRSLSVFKLLVSCHGMVVPRR
jgi:RNA polymerase sigma factor (TIGR02999 family)